jgi:undecaprenyl-diphosphatase
MLALYALAALSIVGLIILVRNYPLSSFDFYVTHELQEIKSGRFTGLMKFISLFGNSGMMPGSVIFVSLLFFVNHYHRESRYILAVLIADVLSFLVKLLVNRPRPTLEDAIVMLKFHYPAFPSGHVVHYVVFFGFLIAVMVVKKKIPLWCRTSIGIFSAFLIVSISVSRIYLGAHWATDVVGAYLFGFIFLGALLTFYLKEHIEHHGRDPEKKV